MKTEEPFAESYRRKRTAGKRRTRDCGLVSPSSGGCSRGNCHSQLTESLHYEKLRYALLSEERRCLRSSWFSYIPRGRRSKSKVSNKLIVMINDIAGGIFDKCPCPRSSTSQPHAPRKGRKQKTRPKDEWSDSEEILPQRIHIRGRADRCWNRSNTFTNERGKLDSATFLRYLMHTWSALPEDKVKLATYFDPLWLDLYANGNNPAMVLNWIKGKDIFSKTYVFVPIVIWSHWSLLIFCHLGENVHSKTNVPCMLLLDSLNAIGPTRLEPVIRRLLFDIYRSEDRPESHKELKKMRLLVPKVPQQKKGDECGFYVLYYVKLFLENAPENFDISAGYPYFMKKDWFSAEEMESFCEGLDALPIVLSQDDDDDNDEDDDCVPVEPNDVCLIGNPGLLRHV